MYLIVGLGNPSREYQNTRHNIGFDAVDVLADAAGIKINNAKFKSLYGTGYLDSQKVVLLKPQTFMNLSGEAVRAAVDFYKIDVDEELIVVCDDINLSVGKLRIREKGSAGGHNGLKNIIAHTGTEGFTRVKMGVGEKPAQWDLADWVLGHFDSEDRKLVDESCQNAVSAIRLMIAGETDKAMNLYNAKKEKKPKPPREDKKAEAAEKKEVSEEIAEIAEKKTEE